jgi:PAS domain-containing protein
MTKQFLHEFATENWQGVVIECTPLEQSALQNAIYRLQLRNQELEDIVEASSDELIVTDGEGRILYVSGDVEDLYNIPKTDLIGKSVSFSMKSVSCRYRRRPSCWILCRTADSPG